MSNRTLAALVVVAALGVGAIVGAVVGNSTSAPDRPTAPPDFAAGFPNAAKQAISGATITAIAKEWLERDNSFTCKPDTDHKPGTGAKSILQCDPKDKDFDVWTSIEYDDDTHVREVTAYCNYPPGSEACRSLFANLADVILQRSADLRKRGSQWAGKNADSDSATVIGGVYFETDMSSHRILAAPWV